MWGSIPTVFPSPPLEIHSFTLAVNKNWNFTFVAKFRTARCLNYCSFYRCTPCSHSKSSHRKLVSTWKVCAISFIIGREWHICHRCIQIWCPAAPVRFSRHINIFFSLNVGKYFFCTLFNRSFVRFECRREKLDGVQKIWNRYFCFTIKAPSNGNKNITFLGELQTWPGWFLNIRNTDGYCG
jgi:hypothetical protein